MASKAMEKPASAVPALVNTPALEIGAEDVALPRMYIGQFMSESVQEGTVPAGSIYVALGKDDPDPQVLWTPPAKNAKKEQDGVRFYVLGVRRGKSVSEDGELTLYAYDDPDAPADAWVTYNYFIAIPSHDEEVPFKWLLTRTGTPTAKQMNMVLKRNAASGPAWVNAFEAKTVQRENTKGKYFVPRVVPTEAVAAEVEVAERLAVMISGATAEVTATGDEPAI